MKQHNRGFLNPKEGMAAFEWEVNTHDIPEKRKWIGADFTISDCNRQISLEFGCDANVGQSYEYRTKEQTIEKLDLLINELQKFRAVIASIEIVKVDEE